MGYFIVDVISNSCADQLCKIMFFLRSDYTILAPVYIWHYREVFTLGMSAYLCNAFACKHTSDYKKHVFQFCYLLNIAL